MATDRQGRKSASAAIVTAASNPYQCGHVVPIASNVEGPVVAASNDSKGTTIFRSQAIWEGNSRHRNNIPYVDKFAQQVGLNSAERRVGLVRVSETGSGVSPRLGPTGGDSLSIICSACSARTRPQPRSCHLAPSDSICA